MLVKRIIPTTSPHCRMMRCVLSLHLPARYLILFQILRALSYLCKVQSSLSRDEIINLYERVGIITDCLVNYDIEDDDSLLQPPAARLDDTGDTNASSSASHFIGNVHWIPFTKVGITNIARFSRPLLDNFGQRRTRLSYNNLISDSRFGSISLPGTVKHESSAE
jgi:hypothetical protein